MNRIKEWITDEAKFRIVRIVISGIALIISLGKWVTLPGRIDMAWIAILLCGIPIIIGAVRAVIKEHDITADVLVSLALIGSLIAEEFFAAGEVAFIMEIGSALEDYTSAKAKKGIRELIQLMPKMVRVRRGSAEKMIPVEEVKAGDTIMILAGETIPTDGVITSGTAAVDQSVMTGESIPIDKTVGDTVMSGTVNKTGVFEYTASTVVADSSLQKMIDLAEQADEKKAPIISLADKWAAWLVIAAFTAALLTFFINWAVLSDPSAAFLRAVTVLVVVCPCAFILATPTAIVAGIGNASKYGMIVKSGEALQRFGTIDTVAFDKTGTLTYGELGIKEVKPLSAGFTEKEILDLAAVAEARSEHPIGQAICAATDSEEQASSCSVTPGKGIAARYEGMNLLVGKADFLKENNIKIDEHLTDEYQDIGATVVFLAVDGTAAGLIALSDTLRESAADMIRKLRDMNVESVLLTGDNPAAARVIADKVRVSAVRSELLPGDKQKIIREYQKQGHTVCMIGDGINDAVALRTADAAIAMGGIGSDIAIESSDVVLVQDDISRVPYLIDLSRKVLKKIRTNIIISLSLNALATVLAATGILNAIVGALVHNAGSVFVVLNSIFLLSVKDTDQPEK
ncbi:MAG: heavy metal translocating P-type ATPase [Anaerovoracaceae bacterium]|jgi:heavy metal translocating P-type ATPase